MTIFVRCRIVMTLLLFTYYNWNDRKPDTVEKKMDEEQLADVLTSGNATHFNMFENRI